MKETVAQLFSMEARRAYVTLMWGGRLESSDEIAARIWSSMETIREHVYGDPRYGESAWNMLGEDGLSVVPVPDSLPGVEEVARKNTDTINGVRTDATAVQFDLCPDLGSKSIASFYTLVGEGQTATGNTISIRFAPEYPLGTEEEAADLFRGLVRTWQPDAGILSTNHITNAIPDLHDTYAGCMTWISEAAFGSPPPLENADAEAFGDGFLLTAHNWTVSGVRKVHEELLAAGSPAITDFPVPSQKVPEFPAHNSNTA